MVELMLLLKVDLLNPDEMEAINNIRRAFNGMKAEEAVDKVIEMFI